MANSNKYHNGRIPRNEYSANSYDLSGPNNHFENNDGDEINLKELLFLIWTRKWIVVGFVLLVGLLAGVFALMLTPTYQSEGSLIISQPRSQLSGLGLESGGALGDILSSSYGIGAGSSLTNELEVLRSRKLSLAIADSLIKTKIMTNGQMYPILFRGYPENSTITTQDTVALRLSEKLLFAKAESGADVIKVTYESPSALASGQIINIALSQYQNLSTQQKRTSASSASNFLENERAQIIDSLKIAEENLREFMNDHKVIQVDAQTQELIENIAVLEASKQEARAQLVAANSAIEQYQNQLNDIKPGLAEQYSEAVGAGIERLQYAKSELELNKQQLLAQNPNLDSSSPQIKELDRQITSYKNKIKQLTQDLMKQSDQYLGFLGGTGVAENVSELNQKMIEFKVQQKQYQAQIDVINAQLADQQTFFNNLPDNIIELARLKRDVKVNEELFEAVTRQYAQTSFWEQSQFGLGRVLDNGYTPEEPAAPNIPLYIFLGFIVGGVLSIGYIFIGNEFKSTIKSAESLKKRSDPLLAVIPAMHNYIEEEYGKVEYVKKDGNNISTHLLTLLAPNSTIAESYRRLENSLIYSNNETGSRTIAITSCGKEEGKTTTVANLGVVLAEAGYKTLLIDADFRRSQLTEMFGLGKSPGITEVLSNELGLQDAVQDTVASGLSLLGTGRPPTNIAAITRSHPFLELLTEVENEYDIVLIDTAPFGIVTDSSPILSYATGVAVVAKFGSTSEVGLGQILESLHSLDVTVWGIILNGYDYSTSTDAFSALNYGGGTYKEYYQERV